MTRPRLILHAGLHKTGTTAIQAFATRHRKALRSRGVWYPTFEPVGRGDNESHNRLAHSLARTGKSGSFGDDEIGRLVEHWRTACGRDRLLLSAEAFSRHVEPGPEVDWTARRRAYLERVATVLSGFDVEVVLVLRRQDEFAHSAYLENIMKGSRRAAWPFARFRDYLAERHLRYEDNLDAFAHAFGGVRVLVYDDLRQMPAFCGGFLGALGIDAAGLDEPGMVRRSLSARQARIKRALLPLIVARRQNGWINALLRRPGVERIAGRMLADTGNGLWESAAVRRAWQQRHDAENERIRARFLPERERLFPEPPEGRG